MNYYYIQDHDYEEAEKNGISRSRMYKRVYVLGWDIERAKTTPVRVYRKGIEKYKEIAKQNKIREDLFYQRLNNGMSMYEAATVPFKSNRVKTFTEHEIQIMTSNGISVNTARHRMKVYLWSKHRAITEPIHTEKRKKYNV